MTQALLRFDVPIIHTAPGRDGCESASAGSDEPYDLGGRHAPSKTARRSRLLVVKCTGNGFPSGFDSGIPVAVAGCQSSFANDSTDGSIRSAKFCGAAWRNADSSLVTKAEQPDWSIRMDRLRCHTILHRHPHSGCSDDAVRSGCSYRVGQGT